MVDVKIIEKQALENRDLSKYEMDLAKNLRSASKIEIKRAKTREKISILSIKLADIQNKMAKTQQQVTSRRQKAKKAGLIDILEIAMDIEQKSSILFENKAKNQKNVTVLTNDIAEQELKIAEENVKLASERMDMSSARERLSKIQYAYVKDSNSGKPHEELFKKENEFVERKVKIAKALEEVLEREQGISKI